MFLSSALTKNLNRFLESPRVLPVFLAAIAVVYTLAYLAHPGLPGNSIHVEGWWGWWDQGHYLKCATSIANGVVSSDTYVYPLGYSLVAAPFARLMPKHPFFLANLLFVVGIVWTFFRIATRLVRPLEAYALIILFAFFYRGMLADSVVIPWNTIPTHFLLYAILYFVAFKRPTPRDVYLAIGCLTVLYVFKVVEFICAGPLVAVAILSLRDRRQILRVASIAAVSVASVIGAMMLINHAVFGVIWSSYELNQRRIGAGAYPLFLKLYLLFVSGGPIFRESEPMLLSHAPWLLLVIPGIVYLWQRFGLAISGVLLSFALCIGLYASYNDLGPGNLFRYYLIHYFAWLLPLLALITYAGLKEARRTRLSRWSLVSIPVLLFLICFVTLRERAVGSFAANEAPTLSIPEPSGRSTDWVFLQGTNTLPALTTRGVPWQPAIDFQYGIRTDGLCIFPSKFARTRALEISPANVKEVRRVDYGELVWRFRWAPQWLLYQWTRRFTRAHASFLGKQPAVDKAGPAGSPDGVPDYVMTVELPRWVMSQIKDWNVELPDNRGRWFSFPNAVGSWLITPDFPPELQTTRWTRVVRLCLPDNGQINDAPLVHVRATDAMGQLVLESEFRNDRAPATSF